MPFADEPIRVTIVDYQPWWPDEFVHLAAQLGDSMDQLACGIDHVGSISVPGLAAKDCIDIQIRVGRVDEPSIVLLLPQSAFAAAPGRA